MNEQYLPQTNERNESAKSKKISHLKQGLDAYDLFERQSE
jgi:hypothetical protein